MQKQKEEQKSGIEINAKRIRNIKSHEQNALKYHNIIIIIIIIYLLKVSNCSYMWEQP